MHDSRSFSPYHTLLKAKQSQTTTRIKRLLELISSYSFNLVLYKEEKISILSGFLLGQKHDDSSPHEITPITFNMHNILHERYYNIGKFQKISSTNAVSDKI